VEAGDGISSIGRRMVIGYSLLERFVFNGTGWFNRIGFKNGFSWTRTGFHRTVKLVILDSFGFKGFGSTTFWTVGFGPPQAGQDTGLVWIWIWFGFRGYRISINF